MTDYLIFLSSKNKSSVLASIPFFTMDFSLPCQLYSLYNLFLMLFFGQRISLLQFPLWDHFAPTTSKINLYNFFRYFRDKLSIDCLFLSFDFKLILVIFLEVFFFNKVVSFDNSNFFYAFDKYKHILFSCNLTDISILIKPLPPCFHFRYSLSMSLFAWSAPCIAKVFLVVLFIFFQHIYLPINNSGSIC